MNTTYRSLWNESLGAWVAASENTRACGKRSGSRAALTLPPSGRLRAGLMTALLAMGGAGWSSLAQAQSVDCSASPFNAYNSTASCMGLSSQASGIGATALGSLSQAQQLGGLAVGYNALSSAQNSISLGFQAYTTGVNSIYLGARTGATTGALGGGSIGIGTDVTASGGNAIAVGSQALTSGDNATSIGVTARATGLRSLALGFQANAAALDSVAQGNTATAGAQNAIAVGFQSIASQLNSVYIGSRTVAGTGATAVGAIAIGTDVTASQLNASAIGFQSKATGQSAVAVGPTAVASGTSAMALGTGTLANNVNAVALGASANATAAGASALGTFANASGANSTAVGVSSTASGLRGFAGGWGSNAVGADAAAIGTSANAAGTSSAALGNLANASADFSLAMGNQALSSGVGSVAAGSGANAAADGTVAMGNNAAATVTRATALGFGSAASGQNATAVGSLANASAAQAVAIGNSAKASAANAIAMGTSTVADSADAVAIGNSSRATGGKAVAIGSGNVASGNGAVAIGDPNTATGDGAIANGLDNTATGNGSVAMGNTNKVGGGGQDVSVPGTAAQGAVGIGYQNTVVGQGSVAIGSTSKALAAGAVAFGDTAVANNAGDVALGSGSVTATAVGTAGITINGTPYTFQGTTPTSTVSVGSAGAERTITNVAAGRISGTSTDAINGSQLSATNSAIADVATTAGKGWNLSANGGAPQNIAPGGTADFANGSNTTVTRTGNQIRVDVVADPTFNSVTTGNTKIDNNGLTIVGGPSVTLTGIDAGSKVITNVAPGVAGTDAVNIDQLTTTVAGSKTRYYQVNSTGGGNEANDGATGADAIASGKNATAAGASSVAMGLGATAGTANSVALGAGSVTATAVATPSTTINGTVYNFQGIAPVGTVSVGTFGGERTITNVAAGRISGSSTDAINGSQLSATNQSIEDLSTTVTANKIRYFSVQSTGGGNEDNLGAQAADAVAVGKDASSTVNGGVALGAGSVSDRAIAGSTGNIPAGSSLIPFNTTDRTLLGALSVGSATTYRQITNVADGTQAQDAVTVRQLSGALQSFAVTPIQYFHANSTAADSLAIGTESVAVGPQTVVNGNNGVGIGNGAIVQQSAPGGIAIGQGATSHLADSIALGTQSSAAAVQGVALGAGTSVTQAGGVALGAGSVASTAAGVAGYVPPTATDAQRIAIGATTSTLAAVSVGDAANGQFRQITGVAAGTADSDAVNVSQLRGVQGQVAVIDQSTVKYDTNADGTTNYNSVTMGGSNATGPVTVHNVAPGVAGTDAVNVNQLNAVSGGLNNRINALSDRLDGVEKNAYAGVAAAMALQMPGSYVPGKTVMRIGAGSFKGQSAVGVSFRRTSENNAWSITGGVATSRAGVGATVGAEWVFN
ncbi:ESPR-type extended signal peptide-containing protein [Variovorax paradoxus]|uniref:ESPR-type extended signal peptide-containing protein n=1 Tax=Variovorax paradoxus TaxID=34073 RepID=UPI0021AD4FB0|nr:ESPR-type extended signal peptide-containing protein [Variovorax paradoxus]UVH58908.1 ESPR-type extended signal peptide-containing protein [Variovorax paradoxus]